MALEININGETVFSQGSGQYDLFPFDESERDSVIKSLIAALATLSGVMPLLSTSSKEDDSGRHCSKTEQCQDDREGGVVLHLSRRQGTQNGRKEPQ